MLTIISGAFGVFRTDLVLAVGAIDLAQLAKILIS